MSTRQKYAGKGNFIPFSAKKAKKSPLAAQLPEGRESTPSSTPTPKAAHREPKQIYNTKWENAPLERLGELLALKQSTANASVMLSGNSVQVKAHGLLNKTTV